MRFKHIHIIAALFLIVGMCIQCVVAYQRAAERVQERMGLEMQVAQEKLLFELYDAYDVEHQLKEFQDAVLTSSQDPTKADALAAMLAYQDVTHGQKAVIIERDNRYTCSILHRLGFHWTEPDDAYIHRMLTAISQLGFFNL